jgi:hypothetical protein
MLKKIVRELEIVALALLTHLEKRKKVRKGTSHSSEGKL